MVWLAALLPFYLGTAVVALAAVRPDYSHVRDTISQLGETGAPRARLASYGVFLPTGLALGAIVYLAHEREAQVSMLAAFLALGYLGAALFPCDRGAPSGGSWRQRLHNTCGRLQYLGGAYALFRLAQQHDLLTFAPVLVTGLVSLASLVPSTWSVRGLIQRIAELTLFIALALAVARGEGLLPPLRGSAGVPHHEAR